MIVYIISVYFYKVILVDEQISFLLIEVNCNI